MARNTTHTPISPLYTPKDKAKFKQALLRRLGPDIDGASRVTNRIDGSDGTVLNAIKELQKEFV